MPAKITTVEFRFDQEGDSKDGMFFQGPIELLALPKEGDFFQLDKPQGLEGVVSRLEVNVSGRFTEVILHCNRKGRFSLLDSSRRLLKGKA